jgi:hypothetical protein
MRKTLLLVILCCSVILGAQTPGLENPSGLEGFNETIPEPSISLVQWEQVPAEGGFLHQVVLDFRPPTGYYQQRNDDFFYIEVAHPYLTVTDQTLSPLRDFLEKYGAEEGVQMVLKGESAVRLSELSLKVHFQICDYNGVCFLPSSQELSVKSGQNNTDNQNLWIVLALAFLGGWL